MSERPWLVARAAATPSAPALSLSTRDFTWSELEVEARAIEAALARQGVLPGDLVATLLGSADFARVVHGIWLRGAAVLPIHLRLSAPEIAFQLRDSGARWLAHGTGELADRARVLLADLPELRPLALYAAPLVPPMSSAAPPPLEAGRPLVILYTSGTTGRPKGVVLSAENFRASARASQQRLDSRVSDRCLACMPLSHVGGLSILTRSVLHGSCVQVHEGFDPGAVAKALEADAITDVSFVANMLARTLAARGDARAPRSLRNVLLGGGPAPPSLLLAARLLGYPLAPSYGLTEATSQVATRSPRDTDAIGLRPLAGVEVRVDGAEGAEGEILVRGPTVMSGYRNRSDETARALRDGWLHTGDIGRAHPDGTLTILDRRSDLIISGGENVYPAEIESVLAAHPCVSEVGVGSQADERYGARPVAWYVATGDAPSDGNELADFCRERLAAFKVPVAFHRVARLPRTAAGKLIRAELGAPR